MQKSSGNEKFINKKSIKAIIFGILVGAIVVALLFLISAVGILQMNSFPENIVNYIILAILGIGGIIAGYITGRMSKTMGLLYGSTTGILLFIIVFLAGISSIGNGVSLFTLFKLVVLTATSAIGGILAVNKKEKINIK